MTTPQHIIQVRSAVDRHYGAGYCCSEASLLAVAEWQNIESPLVPKMATAFCGGMSRTGGTCGALTGAILGVSLALGRSAANGPRDEVQEATQQLVREFEQTFGYRNCGELKGQSRFGSTVEGADRMETPCATYTRTAAEMAARILGERGKA